MEDVLDLYQRPEEPARPIVCVDETSKQHLREVRGPLPGSLGRPLSLLILNTSVMA